MSTHITKEAPCCEVFGVSVDSLDSHFTWKNTPLNQGNIWSAKFPLASDLSKNVSKDNSVLPGESVALRGLFLIDKEDIVRHAAQDYLPLVRSVDEALRIVDALQYFEDHGEVCPVNWNPGEDVIKPTAEGIAEYL